MSLIGSSVVGLILVSITRLGGWSGCAVIVLLLIIVGLRVRRVTVVVVAILTLVRLLKQLRIELSPRIRDKPHFRISRHWGQEE
jgi:hypothetical protein